MNEAQGCLNYVSVRLTSAPLVTLGGVSKREGNKMVSTIYPMNFVLTANSIIYTRHVLHCKWFHSANV